MPDRYPEIDKDYQGTLGESYQPSEEDSKKIAKTVWRRRQYHDKRRDWQIEATKDLNYYTLKQWTKSQQDELEARGQAPLIIDRITPAIKQLVSILTANAPTFRCTGVSDDDVRVAQMFSDIIQYIWYKNDGNEIAVKWIKDMLIFGVAYLYWYYDENGDEGKGSISFERLHPFDVYIDPESRKEDLSDSSSMIFSRIITRERALALFPDLADRIEKLLPDKDYEKNYTDQSLHDEEKVKLLDEVTDENKDKLRYYEEYTKQKVKFTTFIDAMTGETKTLDPEKASAFVEDKEIARGIEVGEIKIIDVWKTRIHKRQVLGDILINEELLPVSIYPIVPLFYEHQENPYPMGAIRGLRSLQDEINHRRSLMIAHATASTNAKLLYLKGTFDDDENIEQVWARPSAAIPVNPIGGQRIGDSIMTPAPQPLPSALYQLEAEAKHDIEYNIGLFSISQGDPSNAPSTFRATLAIEEYGSRRHNLYARKIGYALRRAGKVCLGFIQNYMTGMDVVRLVEPSKIAIEQNEARQINWPVYDQYGNEIAKLNDLSVGEFDIMIVDGSMLPSNRWALLETYMQMFQIGAIDKLELWKKTDIVDREGLMLRFAEIEQLKAQLQQMEQALEQAKSDNTRMRQKLQTSEINTELQKAKTRMSEAEVGYKDEARRAVTDLKIATREEQAFGNNKENNE